jgi:CheY-like chemotaxis protein
VGHRLHPEDQVLLVDDVKANKDNIVDLMRGSNLPGTKVHLSVRRAASGATDYVVCVRAPLNHVEHTQDLHLLLADAKKNAAFAGLVAKIEEKLKVIEDNHEKTVNHQVRLDKLTCSSHLYSFLLAWQPECSECRVPVHGSAQLSRH